MFDAVNHIVARDGIDAQTGQAGIDGDVALAGAGIAMAVGDAGGHRQIAVTDAG